MPVRLATVILAAGEASRYGDNKLLARHPGGSSLLSHVLSQYQPLSPLPITLVTGRYHDEIVKAMETSQAVRIICNEQWQQGMGGSIATGVRAVLAEAEEDPASLYPTHILIGLGDMPQVTPESLGELIDKAVLFPNARIASEVDGYRMSPAIFPLADSDALSGLHGQKGAAKLLNAAVPECIAVPHPQAAVDIDRPEDWQKLSK